MNASGDERDREILEYLHRVSCADVQSLCDLLGVTRTAIRQRISRLESDGVIVSETIGHGRGRPRLIYRLTAEGLHALGENYRELAVVLWETVSGFEDDGVRAELVRRVRDSLARRIRSTMREGESLGDRIDSLARQMKTSGFNVESDRSGGLTILRETSCPFPMLAEVNDSICEVEREVLQQVIGAPVEFRSRCREGGGCCEFQVHVQSPESSGSD